MNGSEQEALQREVKGLTLWGGPHHANYRIGPVTSVDQGMNLAATKPQYSAFLITYDPVGDLYRGKKHTFRILRWRIAWIHWDKVK